MAKYLLLKHYRGGPSAGQRLPAMDQWTPDEIDAHIDVHAATFADRLESAGEYATDRRWRPKARWCATTARGARR